MSTRSLDLSSAPTEAAVELVPMKLKTLAKDFYFNNLATNKTKGVADKARKSLLKGLGDAGLGGFSFHATTPEGNTIALDVSIGAKASDKVNVQKLIDKVGLAKVLHILSASKGAVVDAFGAAVAEQVCESVMGEQNVNVKPNTD